MKAVKIFREWMVNGVLYRTGLSWRLYYWYQRGGEARALSIFLGQSIKFWRRAL